MCFTATVHCEVYDLFTYQPVNRGLRGKIQYRLSEGWLRCGGGVSEGNVPTPRWLQIRVPQPLCTQDPHASDIVQILSLLWRSAPSRVLQIWGEAILKTRQGNACRRWGYVDVETCV